MPDNNILFTVKLDDGRTEQWTPEQYEQVKDQFYGKYPTAQVTRTAVYNPEEGINNGDVFNVELRDGRKETWTADQMRQAGGQLMQKYPDAYITKDSDMNRQYWQEKADATNKALADFDAANGEFMRDYQSRPQKDIRGSLTGMVNPATASFINANKDRYDRLVAERDGLLRAKYENPLIKNEYETSAQGAADRRDYYNDLARQASDRDEKKDWQRAAKLQDDIRKMYEAPSQSESNGFAQYIENFNKGQVDKFSDQDFYTSGLSAIARNHDLRNIAEKVQNVTSEKDVDQILTDSEKAQLMAFYNLAEAQRERADDIASAYNAGQTAAESVKFMAEFLLSQGLANVAGKFAAGAENAVVSWFGRQLMSNQALERAVKAGSKSAKIGADVAKFAAKSTPARVASNMGLKPLVQGLWHAPTQLSTYETIADNLMKTDNNGDLVERGQAIGEGWVDSIIENWSESLGGAAEGMLKPKFSGKTPFGRFARWLNETGPAKVLGEAGFNGLLGEIAEEWAGNAVRLGVGLMSPEDFKDFASWEKQLEMAAAFAPMTLFGVGSSAASAIRNSSQYKALSGKVQDIMARQGSDGYEIQYILDSKFDTPEDIGKKLAPYLKSISENAQKNGATEQDKEDYKTMLDFARFLGMDAVLKEQNRLQQVEKNEGIKNNIFERVGRFWEGPDDTPVDQQQVRIVTDADGKSYYVTASDANGVTGVDTITGEHKILNNGQFTEGEILPMADYLQQQSDILDKDAEQRRMQEEAMEQINAVRQQVEASGTVPMGTESEEITAQVLQSNANGAELVWKDADGNEHDEVLPWTEIASKLGTPIVVKTDAELKQDAADAYDKAVKRLETYKKIPKATRMVVNLEDVGPVELQYAGATMEDGQIMLYGRDEQGQDALYPEELVANLEEMMTAPMEEEAQQSPFANGEQVTYVDEAGNTIKGTVTDADNGGGYTTLKLENGTTANISTNRLALDNSVPRDFNGRALPLRTNSATGETEVDSDRLWQDDPEAWTEWNDTNPNQDVSSEKKLAFNISALDSRIAANTAKKDDLALKGGHQDEVDAIKVDIDRDVKRRDLLQSLLDGRIATAARQDAAVQNQQPAAQPQQSEVPVSDKGAKQYTEAPARATYEDIYNDEAFDNAEEAYGFIQGKVANANARVKKAQEAVNKVKQQNVAGRYGTTTDYKQAKDKAVAGLDAAQAELDYWNSVKALADADIERAKKIEQLRENELSEPKSLHQLVANAFIGYRNRLNKESFKKETGYSDADLKPFFQLWAKKGQGSTVLAMAEDIAANDDSGLVPIDDNGHKDIQAVRDAILEVFQQASSPSDLYEYTYNQNAAVREAEQAFVESQQEAPVAEVPAEPITAEHAEEAVAVNEPINVQPQMEAEGYQLSDEVDENGRQFVLNSQGGLEFGSIPAESGLTPAPILLSEGKITNPVTNDGYGLVHIEARHGEQIRKAGYESVLAFIESVAQNYDVIREGKDREGNPTYLLQLTDKHNNTLIVELSGDGSYYNINTAGIFKTSYGKNRKEVYNRHTTVKQPAETVGASQDGEQSGTTPTSSMSAPTPSSGNEGSENSEETNISEKKVEGELPFGEQGEVVEAPAAEQIAAQEEEVTEQPAEATRKVSPYHPDNLRKAYESGNAKKIAKAEKAMSDYIGSSNSIALLRGTENQAKRRRKASKKETPEYKTQDFIAKECAKRLKELDKTMPAVNGMSAVKAYDAAFKTLTNRWDASKEELEQAIAWYEQDKAAAQSELDALGDKAQALVEEGDFYVVGLINRIGGADANIRNLQVEMGRFQDLTEAQKNVIGFVEGKTPEQVDEEYKAKKAEEQRMRSLRDRIAKWKEYVGDIFEVLESIDDVAAIEDAGTREQVLRAMASGQSVEGWYNTRQDKAYIFLPDIKDVKMLDRKVIHEVLAHKGLRALLGEERYNKYLDHVWDNLMDEEARQWGLDYNSHLSGKSETEQRRAAADEFIAHIAENDEAVAKLIDDDFWDRLEEFLKNLINDMVGADIFKDATWFHEDLSRSLQQFHTAAMREQEARAADERREDTMSAISGEESKAMATAEAQENPQVPVARSQEKYEDFGEKIGMARKDTATTTGKKGDKDSRPAWMKKYQTINVERVPDAVLEEARRRGIRTNGFVPTEEDIMKGTDYSKPFIAFYEEKSKSRYGMPRRRYITGEDRQPIIFTSQEQYESTLPVFEAKDQGYRVIEKGGKFFIVRPASNNKLVEYAQFNTREEAVAYLASPEGCTDMLNRKRENYELPALEVLTRNNMPDYRKGKDVTPEDILKTFGFRGGEFGNWLNAEERQQFLNYAYDAFMDLAQMLGISPRALSLNGELSIAFGARGQGGSNAAAHYESTRAVINLTKMYGAGSLAHEWAHALDNYFGLMDAKRERIRDEKESTHNHVFLSEGRSYKRGVRKEVVDAFNEVMKALTKKTVTRKIELDKARELEEKARNSFEYYLKQVRGEYERGLTTYKYNRKTKQREEVKYKPTEEQLAEFDRLTAMLPDDKTFGWQYTPQKNGFRASGEVAEKLYALVKDVMSNRAGQYGPLHNLFYATPRLQTALARLKDAQDGKTETVTVDTDFMEESKWFDRGRASDYWTKDLEMFARALESVLANRMKEQGKSSDYLTYLKAPLYASAWGHVPYPVDDELKVATEAFDKLFNTIQERVDETTGNTVLFSRSSLTTEDGSVVNYESRGVLPAGAEHESIVERTYRKTGAFSFMGKNKIATAGDVAFIFKELETAATENSFVVYVKDGIPTILHTGIGNAYSTAIDTAAFVAGLNDFAPDEVYMVHNHPSGNVRASMEDLRMVDRLQKAADKVSVYGIIIDTVSGEYGQFDAAMGSTLIAKRTERDEGDYPIEVHSFDKLVFQEDYRTAIKETTLSNASTVASYLSAHRLGNGSKVAALMVDRYNKVVGNLVLDESAITMDNAAELAGQVANVAIHNAAQHVILYGDFNQDARALQAFKMNMTAKSGSYIDLMDVVRVDGRRTQSLEEGTLKDNPVRFSRAQSANKVAGKEYPDDADLMDEGLRFSLTKNNRNTIEAWLNKRPDLSEGERKAVVEYIDNLDDSKIQLATGKWFAQGKVRLPEDQEKIDQAVSVAGKAKVDPLQYDSPMALLNAHADFKPTEKRTNPDDVPTLHRAKEYPEYGIVVYDVEDSEESRQNMRQIINTHYGKDASPWCLLQGDKNGKLTPESANYWRYYDGYPKQVAFKDGKLLAFSANDTSKVQWWNRQDEASDGIPMTMKVPGDRLGRTATYDVDEDGKIGEPYNIFKGNRGNGLYETWFDLGDNSFASRTTWKDGVIVGKRETWYKNGQLKYTMNFNDQGERDGWDEEYYENGQPRVQGMWKDNMREGQWQSWFENGKRRLLGYYEFDRPHGEEIEWYENGRKWKVGTFEHGKPVGEHIMYWENGKVMERVMNSDGGADRSIKSYYSNGVQRTEEQFKDRHADGVWKEWSKEGVLIEENTYVKGRREGAHRSWHSNGNMYEEGQYKYNNRYGEWKWYDYNGNLAEISDYDENGYEIENTTFWPNGNKKKYINRRDGIGQQWDEDGNEIRYSKGEQKPGEEEVVSDNLRFSRVTDPELLDKLNKGKTIKAYRAMALIDGKLYSPMSTQMRDEQGRWTLRQPTELGEWEQSDEHPEKAVEKNGKYVYVLKKPDGTTVEAAYNPYIHTSLMPLNDQFTSAYKRPELITVEVEVPESELTSGYKAEKAKDAVGKMAWHSGPVAGLLPEGKKREVILSRYDKPIRIVPDSEVADMIVKQFDGKEIPALPWNVFTPSLREELSKRGVQFADKAAGTVSKKDKESYKNTLRYSKVTPEQDAEYLDAVNAGDMEKAQQMVERAARQAFPESAVVDEFYVPKVVLHGTRQQFNAFDPDKIGSNTDAGWLGRGFYFYGNNPEYASQYANFNNPNGGRIIKAYLNIENPYWASVEEFQRLAEANSPEASEEFTQKLKEEGYDGVYYNGDGNEEWVAFYPSQIKSADTVTYDEDGNIIPLSERFNNKNEDIRFAKANANQNIFISNAENAVNNISMQKATPEQWLKMIEKNGGLKAGEDKWLGLSDWLKEQGKPVTFDNFFESTKVQWKNVGASIPLEAWNTDISKRGEVKYSPYKSSNSRYVIDRENGKIYRYSDHWGNVGSCVWPIDSEHQFPEESRAAAEKAGARPATIGVADISDFKRLPLTKDAVLDYINQNRIRIEEVHYGDSLQDEIKNTVGRGRELSELQAEIDELKESDDYQTIGDGWLRDEFLRDEMKERYGDDFELGYDIDNGKIAYQIDPYIDREYREEYDGPTRPINNVRIGYTTDGLDNKREIALTVPTIEPWNENDNSHFGDAGDGRAVAWARFGDATDSEGKRVLFIDEIQSKRHQEGREKGYKDNAIQEKMEDVAKRYHDLKIDMHLKYGIPRDQFLFDKANPEITNEEDRKRYEELAAEYNRISDLAHKDALGQTIPSAPFEKNWHELAMKRMLRLAAEEGYDYVAWTTGEQQAERYDLSKNIHGIRVVDAGEGNYSIITESRDGTEQETFYDVPKEKLQDYVGKELAVRIVNGDNRVDAGDGKTEQIFRGLDLKVGGEGMKGFYDQMLPRFVDKYGKKWGVKTEDMQLPGLENDGITAHAVRVTPEMKESVMEGQLMFSKSDRAVEKAREGGIGAVIGQDNVGEYYREIYRVMPQDMRKDIVDDAMGNGLNFRKATESALSAAARKGYAEDNTGLLRSAAKMLDYYAGEVLTPEAARYILWRGERKQDESDIFGLAEDITMRSRNKIGRYAEPLRFSRSELKENLNAADEAAEATVDEAVKALNDGKKDLKDLLTATRAMRLQKEYDKKTVEAVTNLAKQILKDQFVNEMSRREVARLLGLVRTSVGRSPRVVKRNADTIVEIVIENLLKKEKAAYENLIKKTGTKTNATGVEVLGELDIQGQKMLKAFKAGLEYEIGKIDDSDEQNTLYGMKARVQERLTSKDDAVRAEAEAEDAGLTLAIEYKENIKSLLDDEKSLKEELKALDAAFKDSALSKKSYEEAVDATNDAIRANHIDQVEAYRDFSSKMSSILSQSAEDRSAFLENEKARIREIQHLANSDMQGKSASVDKRPEFVDKLANSPLISFFSAPLGTFDQMLRLFGEKSISGEGYLWNKFMNAWQQSAENEYKGVAEAREKLDKKVSEVFGEDMKWSDLFRKEIDKDHPKVKVSWWDDGKMVDHELTQGQLLYIYMVNKMADGRMKLRRMGIDDSHVAAIVRQMDDRFLTLADWLQNEFLVDLRNKYNAVHERLFGASMAAIEDYFPLVINKRDLNRNEDIGLSDNYESLPSTATGSIIKRRRNSKALDLLNADAFNVVLDHIDQMERWAAFAEFNKDLNALLSYKRFRNQVQNMASVYGSGTALWNNFKDVARIAGNAYHPTVKRNQLDTAAVNVAKGVTAAKISFRVYTALKQLLSMPAFVADANIANLAKSMATPKASWDWAMENLPLFEKRWKSRIAGDTRLMTTDMDWNFYRKQWYDKLSKAGMLPNAFVDAQTVAIGAKSIYDTKYAQYKNEGFSDEEADKKAKRDATVLVNETQQSTENPFVSAVQLDRTVFTTMITVFRNSSMGFQRQVHDAIRNLGKHLKPGYKEESISFMKKQLMRDGLTEEQAAAAAERRYDRSTRRDLIRLATFGFLVEFAWNLGSSIAYLLAGDDDDKKKEMLADAARHALLGGTIEGLSGGNVMSDALDKWAKGESLWNYDPQLLPLFADIKNAYSKMSSDPVAGWNDVINLAVQAGIGVNPQTLTDAVVAVADACNGDLGLTKEAMLLIMRVMQVPQSQLDELYIDELGTTARNARRMSYAQMAQRYADYKINREAPLTGWAYSDEARKKREKAKKTTFKKKVNERK